MQIAVYLRGGEVVEFDVDPDEWFAAFDKGLRKRRGVVIKDLNHGGRLGINPQHVLYWEARHAEPGDD
jgi:hypothetical protein